MLIVALQRTVGSRVAVHAARIHDHLRGLAKERTRMCGIVRDARKGRGRTQLAILATRSGCRDNEQAGDRCTEKRCTKAHRSDILIIHPALGIQHL